MKAIDKKTLKDCGKRMMFDLTENELDKLQETLTTISSQLQQADNVEGIEEAKPMAFPYICEMSYLREDVADKGINRDELFSNTKDVVDGQIRLPKVVG